MATIAQPTADRSSLLRRALQADALISGLAALVALFNAAPIAAVTGIPAALLQVLGAAFLVYVGGLLYTASRPVIDRRTAWSFVVMNFSWVALCAAALIFSWLPLSPLGFWVVVAQALAVDTLGVAQWLGLRRLA